MTKTLVIANTYLQLYAHLVFAVQGRACLLGKSWRDELYKYITGTVAAKNQRLLCIGGVSDLIHFMVGFRPDMALSHLTDMIKANSSRWINEQQFMPGQFQRQRGYGAFTIGKSGVDDLYKYIMNQEAHHKTVSFRKEYASFLHAYDVDYDEQYLLQDFGEMETH